MKEENECIKFKGRKYNRWQGERMYKKKEEQQKGKRDNG